VYGYTIRVVILMKQTILNLFGELTEAKQIIASYHRRTALLSEELASVLAGQSWP